MLTTIHPISCFENWPIYSTILPIPSSPFFLSLSHRLPRNPTHPHSSSYTTPKMHLTTITTTILSLLLLLLTSASASTNLKRKPFQFAVRPSDDPQCRSKVAIRRYIRDNGKCTTFENSFTSFFGRQTRVRHSDPENGLAYGMLRIEFEVEPLRDLWWRRGGS